MICRLNFLGLNLIYIPILVGIDKKSDEHGLRLGLGVGENLDFSTLLKWRSSVWWKQPERYSILQLMDGIQDVNGRVHYEDLYPSRYYWTHKLTSECCIKPVSFVNTVLLILHEDYSCPFFFIFTIRRMMNITFLEQSCLIWNRGSFIAYWIRPTPTSTTQRISISLNMEEELEIIGHRVTPRWEEFSSTISSDV